MTVTETRAVVTADAAAVVAGAKPALRTRAAAQHPAHGAAVALRLLYFVLPLWWLFVSSTKDNAALFSTFGLWFAPRALALGQPADAVHRPRRHLHSAGCCNTIVYAVAAAGRRHAARHDGRLRVREVRLPGQEGLFSARSARS